MRFVVALLLAGCLDPVIGAVPKKIIPSQFSSPKHLLIVAPQDWSDDVSVYAAIKTAQGLIVDVLFEDYSTVARVATNNTAKGVFADLGNQLRTQLIAAKPDYVFLIGDTSVIPTIYQCSDITYSPLTSVSCIYSDYWLSLDDNGKPLFSIGRLLAPNTDELDVYMAKTATYLSSYTHNNGAYMLTDRSYETDDLANFYTAGLRNAGIATTEQALNITENPPENDGLTEASASSVSKAVSNGVSFIGYIGHGDNEAWGYYSNIWDSNISFHADDVIPFVFAEACETALSAPNPPYYPYYDSDGQYQDYVYWAYNVRGKLTAADVNGVSSLQFHAPTEVLSDSMAHHFTSTSEGGAMVYVGETVITALEGDLTESFYGNLITAYTNGNKMIGDIWLEAIASLVPGTADGSPNPEFFQMVGDPSTPFPGKSNEAASGIE